MEALVVDDSSVMRRINQKALEAIGWQVGTAEDGAAALAQLQSQPGRFALLVTDLHMPNKDGMELITELRRDARFAQMKILLVTSDGVLDIVQKAVEAGANDVLLKPFTAQMFAEHVQGLFGA